MAMMKAVKSQTIDDYVAALSGWERQTVSQLRAEIMAGGEVSEGMKWTNACFQANGPVCLIRAEDGLITFGFWRGADLVEIEPRLKRHGKYDMASVRMREPQSIEGEQVRRLVTAAVALNLRKGDP